MVHIVLFAVILVAFLFHNQGKLLQAVPFIMLFLFAALRYGYGNDYFSYVNIYNGIQEGVIWDEEYLYFFLNKVFPSFYLLIALLSFLFVFTVYRLAEANVTADVRFLSVLIFVLNPYLFLMNLSAIRQCIAMVIFIIAIRYSNKNNPVIYILLILLAVCFHKSAIVLLPFYFVANDKPFKIVHYIIFVLFMIFLLFDGGIYSLAEYMSSDLFRDANYLSHVTSEDANSIRATLLTSVYFIYVVGNLKKLKGSALMFSKLYLIGLLFGISAYRLSMFTRVQMYFDVFSIVVLPIIFKQNMETGPVIVRKDNVLLTLWDIINKYLLPFLILVIYLLRYYSFFSNPMWNSFTEYQTIFSVI